jgi:hypothetical protein
MQEAHSKLRRRKAPLWLKLVVAGLLLPNLFFLGMAALLPLLSELGLPSYYIYVSVSLSFIGSSLIAWLIVRRASTRVSIASGMLASCALILGLTYGLGNRVQMMPPPIVTVSRIFAGPNEYPPREFAAYGILAFRSRPSPHDRGRYLMFCNAYIASLPHAFELEVPRDKQMVTVWPLSSDDASDQLNQLRKHAEDICQAAVDNYGLVIALQAIKDAELTGRALSSAGPFLLAWSPSTDKGKQDVLVLVSDLSDITTYEQAHEIFLAWFRDIESDPALWISGWNLQRLRTNIRSWVDKYGEKSLAVFAR